MKHTNISVSCWIPFIRRDSFGKSVLVALLLLGMSFTSYSQVISTIAGTGYGATSSGGYSGDTGPATAAELYRPTGVTLDPSGNIYIADEVNNRVRIVNTSGIINTFAGSAHAGYGGDGGPATAADLSAPYDVAVDASGNVYIADGTNYIIRKVNTSGTITTFAGIHNIDGYYGDGGQATAAELNLVEGVAVDASGNVYIADEGNNLVRKVNTSGIISTFAGLVSGSSGVEGYSGDNGQATAAEIGTPSRITFDASGNVYIADTHNQRIREVNTSGVITTFAGTGTTTYNEPAQATAADFDNPRGIHFDPSGNLYVVSETNDYVLKINTSGLVTKFAGTGNSGYNFDNVLATSAELSFPFGVTTDASGNVYIADYENDRVRKVTPPLSVSGVATNITCNGANNGIALASPAGDAPPYTYSWSPGGKTTSSISSLSVGTYTVHISDGFSETATASVTISQPTALTTGAATTGNVTCNNGSTGSASATPSGGTSPYTYSWSNGITSNPTGSALSAGTYTVTVTDAHTCTATASVTITQPIALSTTASVTANVRCNGGITGSASASPSNGTSPYTYSWSGGGGNASTAGGLVAGTYTLTVTDNCTASATASVTITQPNALTTGASAPNITCHGTTVTATASPANGTVPYTYSWSEGGGTNSTASGLSAGIYTITVHDNCGATATASVSITQPAVLTTGVSAPAIACYGTTVTATASPANGTVPYTYSWSGGGGTNSIASGLGAGTYTITVHDNCGAVATASVSIKSATAITPTAFVGGNISCNGGSNGQAKASVNGGKSPYTYSWSPVGGSTYMAAGLSMGTYTVTVTDNNGCSVTSATSLTQPALLRDSAIITYPQCNGETAGATIGVTGGTGPYSFAWSPNVSSTASATGLTVRSYAVQVKDHNGCNNNLTFSISQPLALRDSVVAASIIGTCNGAGTGSASVGVKYGNPPYTYSWSRNGGNNSSATGLSAGVYTVTVSDGGSCSATTTVTIGQPGTLSATAYSGASITCNGGSNGQAKVTVSGGSSPYIYSWWSPLSNSTYIATGLSAGTYTVSVSDNCGSSASSSAIITQPALLRDSVALTYPVCAGGTGSATIGVKGGTGTCSFAWTPNVSTTASAASLTVRSYVVQVKDKNGCNNNLDFSISQPVALRDSIVKPATVNLSCNGSSIGSATVGVKYGIPPYTYSWSGNGGNSSTAGGLTAGVYTVTVNDGGGCTVTASVTITQPGALTPNAYVGVNITCNGGSTGQAKVSVNGGSTPYTYAWSPGGATSSTVGGLSAGTYTISVMDKCVATATSSVVMTQPAVLSDSIANIYAPACSSGATGEATIGVTGGTTPYKYAWSPNVSSTDSASGLTVRSYIVQVKDNNGCSNDLTLNVTCSNGVTATYKPENTACCPVTENINLYPNPNTGQFTISGLQTGMLLELYDYTGKMISTMTTTSESMQLNIFNQANGVYLIRILDKDGNLVDQKKVVKTQ